jgi:hypothetical protein
VLLALEDGLMDESTTLGIAGIVFGALAFVMSGWVGVAVAVVLFLLIGQVSRNRWDGGWR